MTFEFKAALSHDGQIIIPADVAGQLPPGKELQVSLTWEAPVESDAMRLAKTLREKSYAAAVSSDETVYDSLA
jgi:hypothetical protein